jgi:5'(3')-deoxyribonucleotidase
MKESFMIIKNIKSSLLKNYVNHCATKIQKIFRGHFARKIKVPVKKAFMKIENSLRWIVIGWRIRRIMKTKEIDIYT